MVKMLMEIDPPLDERIVGDDDGLDFPLAKGSFPDRIAPPSPRLLLPRFCLKTTALRNKSFLLIFLGQNPPYSRRWAPKAYQGAHKLRGAPPRFVAT